MGFIGNIKLIEYIKEKNKIFPKFKYYYMGKGLIKEFI